MSVVAPEPCIKDLAPAILKQLSILFNKPDSQGHDWHQLMQSLKLNRNQSIYEKLRDPTKALLISAKECKVSQLCEICLELGREDAVYILLGDSIEIIPETTLKPDSVRPEVAPITAPVQPLAQVEYYPTSILDVDIAKYSQSDCVVSGTARCASYTMPSIHIYVFSCQDRHGTGRFYLHRSHYDGGCFTQTRINCVDYIWTLDWAVYEIYAVPGQCLIAIAVLASNVPQFKSMIHPLSSSLFALDFHLPQQLCINSQPFVVLDNPRIPIPAQYMPHRQHSSNPNHWSNKSQQSNESQQPKPSRFPENWQADPIPLKEGESGGCIFCEAVRPDASLKPCNHLCMCMACAKKALSNEDSKCPICRVVVTRVEGQHLA